MNTASEKLYFLYKRSINSIFPQYEEILGDILSEIVDISIMIDNMDEPTIKDIKTLRLKHDVYLDMIF